MCVCLRGHANALSKMKPSRMDVAGFEPTGGKGGKEERVAEMQFSWFATGLIAPFQNIPNQQTTACMLAATCGMDSAGLSVNFKFK